MCRGMFKEGYFPEVDTKLQSAIKLKEEAKYLDRIEELKKQGLLHGNQVKI